MNEPRLRDVLNDEDYWARRFALRDAYKSRDIETLIAGLKDPDHRIIAADYLGKLRDADARLPLERLLRASDSAVRASGAKALGRVGTIEVVPALTDALNDPEANVQTTAVVALGESGCLEAVDPLIAISRTSDPALVRLALASLRKLNKRVALHELTEISHKVPATRRMPYLFTIAVLRLRGK